MFFKKKTFESTTLSTFNSDFAKAIFLLALIIGTAFYSQIGRSQDLPDAITVKLPEEFSKAYLDSCPQGTMLFSNDSDLIISLNYLQEVYNYRKDVEIIDLKMLELPSYYERFLQNDDRGIQILLNDQITHPAGQLKYPINLNEKRVTNLNAIENHLNDDSLFVVKKGVAIKYFPGRDIGLLENNLLYRFKELDDRNNVVRNHIITRWKKDYITRGELIALILINKNSPDKPIAFANTGNSANYLGFDSYLIQHGLIEILQPVLKVLTDEEQNPKIVIFSNLLNDLLTHIEDKYGHQTVPHKLSNDLLRPLLYQETKHLLETGDSVKALSHLNKTIKVLSPEKYGVDATIYNIGMLYSFLDEHELAIKFTEMYVVKRIAMLESKFVSTSHAHRIAVNNSARELKKLRDFINLHVARFPTRKDYWMSKVENLKSRRKKWAQNIDLD